AATGTTRSVRYRTGSGFPRARKDEPSKTRQSDASARPVSATEHLRNMGVQYALVKSGAGRGLGGRRADRDGRRELGGELPDLGGGERVEPLVPGLRPDLDAGGAERHALGD